MAPQLSDVTTTWVGGHVVLPIGKMNTPLSKEFQIVPLNKIVTSILSSSFTSITPCISNTKALCISQL